MQPSKGKKLAYFALVHVRFDLASDFFCYLLYRLMGNVASMCGMIPSTQHL